MNEFWGITILLFIILTFFICILLRVASYYNKYNLIRHPRIKLSSRGSLLKSGDIILFIAHTHGFTNSLFTWDLYSHARMIVEINKKIYLSESTVDSIPGFEDKELRLPQKSQINPLFKRLKYYLGMIFLMRLKNPLSIEQKLILLDRVQQSIPYPNLLQMIMAILRFPVHNYARHCMQHITWLLDEMELTPKYQKEKGKLFIDTGFFNSSRAITRLPGKLLGNGLHYYTDIVELLYDIDAK